MNDTPKSIFSQEELVITKADTLLNTESHQQDPLYKDFKLLFRAYKKLFKQFVRLIKLSDRQQKELRDLNEIKHDLVTKLEKLSCTDGLTGIPNRRYFDNYFSSEWLRAQRKQSTISLIMMDIDYFKPYNDNYGHAAGDKCLQQVAGVLDSAISRPADIVARYGGEEFIYVLPETDSNGAQNIAQHVLQELAIRQIPHQYSKACAYITLSLGIVTLTPSTEDDYEMLMKRADELLYQAKEAGRNQYKHEVLDNV